jgi:lactoylglutathione lyase
MKMLHTAYRVSDVKRSVDFHARVAFREIGRIVFEDGSMLLMLNLPGDGEVVTLELAYHPKLDSLEIGNGFSHIVVQVDRLDATLAELTARGIAFDVMQTPAVDSGPKTSFVHDPDGYRIELVEWPAGHADGITRSDFA